MRNFKEIVLGIFVILVFGYLVTYIYRYESEKTNKDLAKRINELSPRGGPPRSIDDLKIAIALYENQIERNVKEGVQTGAYWKILGVRLADKKMHNDALGAFERAIYYNTEDPALYYLAGISAGKAAQSVIGFSADADKERERLYNLSENAYSRAIEMDSSYSKPMYGIGILYTFELNRPADAIPHLERYLKIETSDVPAMFVLARAYFMTENFSQAIELYDRIISRTKDQKVKEEALRNIDIVRRMQYE